MRFRKTKNILLAGSTAILLPAPAVLHAQDEQRVLEEIIVTASRRAQGVQDIPFNVSSLSGDELAEAGITRPEDLAKRIAGVTAIEAGARNRNPLSIRGIGSPGTGASDFFTTEATSYYVGETPMEHLNLRIKDVERIEVLRGPQGTLYGGGAMGGTVRYIMNRPDPDAFTARFATSISQIEGAGDFSHDTDIVVNAPLSDRLALRASGNILDQSGFIDAVTFPDKVTAGLPQIDGEDANSEEAFMGRIALRWIVNDAWDAEVSYVGQNQEGKGRQGYTVAEPGMQAPLINHYTYTGFNDEFAKRDIGLTSVDVSGDLGFADLTFHLSNYQDDYETEGDITRFLEGIYTNVVGIAGFGDEVFGDFHAWNENEITSETDTVELRLQATGLMFDWVAGVFYTSQTREWNLLEQTPGLNETPFGSGNPTTVPPNDFNLEAEGDYSQFAVYAEGTYHVTPNLDLTLGIRHFDMDDDLDMYIWYPIINGLDDYNDRDDPCLTALNNNYCTLANSDAEFDDQIFKFNLSYSLSDDMLAYFTYSEGFRRGGANGGSQAQAAPSPAAQQLIRDSRFFAPDSLSNYELGVKSTLLDGRMTLNGAVYVLDWQDRHAVVSAIRDDEGNSQSLVFSQRVNAGDAQSIGVEVELSALLTDNHRLDASAHYNEIEADGDSPYFEDGEKVYGKPDWQASLALSGNYPLGNGMEWGWRTSVAYRDAVSTGGNSLLAELPSYTLLDVSISLSGDRWMASMYSQNLTDERYETATSPEGRNLLYTGKPRSIGVRLSYDL
ncbi:MAG: TonB-dependent receptor [Gammaproteobacteria bacterium]|nr:TonB-dependent receptor [Gammaproteobacteria bacterium]